MRKAKLLLVSVFALSGLVSISSCSDGGSDTPTPTTYKVTTAAGEGTTISLTGDKTEFSGGEIVTFTVALSTEDSTKEIKTVKFGDTSLAVESDGTYEVAMPNEDVTITTTAGDVETPVEPTPIDKTYKVTLKEGLGSKITLSADEGVNTFTAGTEVSFSVTLDNSDLTVLNEVKVGGKVVSETDGLYTFTMPNKDVEIETVTTALGDGSLLTPSDVDETVISNITSVESLTTFLEETATKAEQTYINGGSATLSHTKWGETKYSYNFKIGSNNLSEYEGKLIHNNSDAVDTYVYGVRGLYDDAHYYTLTYGLTDAPEIKTLSVIDDTDEYVDSTRHIEKSEASKESQTAGFTGKAIEYLDEFSSATVPTISLEDDGKHYTITLDYLEDFWGMNYIHHVLTMRLDGDNTLLNARYVEKEYESDAYDDSTESLKPDAVPNYERTFNLQATRGYRKPLTPKMDVSDYALHDYEVFATYDDEQSISESNAVVENGSLISFTYRNNESNTVLLNPKPVQIKSDIEGIATIDASNRVNLEKEGEFTVVFDNGLGELKEVTYTSVRPAIKGLTLDLSGSKIYNGGAVTLRVFGEPELADASATVSVKEGSEGEATITSLGNNEFIVTATKEGDCTLVATSTIDNTVTGEITLKISGEKPTSDHLHTFLTTNTLYYEDNYNSMIYYLNINADGTGQFRADEESWGDVYEGEVLDFTFTALPDPYFIQYKPADPEATSNGYKLIDICVVSSSEVEITIKYSDDMEHYTLTSYSERIDLNA